MYRLFDCPDVTHEAILESHQRQLFESVLPSRSGFTLLISDATELEYTKRESLADDLGQIGNGFRRGYVAQNLLAVDPETRKTLGWPIKFSIVVPKSKREKPEPSVRSGPRAKACFGSRQPAGCRPTGTWSTFVIEEPTRRSLLNTRPKAAALS